ncbi:MAG: DegT/DnrJ/EryC1/StrS family aminotransferase [Thermoanaerobaculia bacterium]
MQIPLYSIKVEEEGKKMVQEALSSGNLKQGKITENFEKEFSKVFNVEYSVATSSGTSALHLSILSLFEKGDEILVPSFTFFATASAVALSGMVPVFCDVELDYFGIDLEDAKKKISKRTKGIIPAHLFGVPQDIGKIENFAREFNLKIIHDCAQSHGALWKGRNLASLGECSCFSFYPTKNLFTGEGGMVCTQSKDLRDMICILRDHGMVAPYEHHFLGFNYRMTDIEASIGLGQLRVFEEQLKKRRENFNYLREGLEEIKTIQFQKVPEEATPGPSLLTGYLKEDIRDEFLGYLKEKGIGYGIYYPKPLSRQKVFVETFGVQECPKAEELSKKVFSLPTHHSLKKEEMDYIIYSIKDFFK